MCYSSVFPSTQSCFHHSPTNIDSKSTCCNLYGNKSSIQYLFTREPIPGNFIYGSLKNTHKNGGGADSSVGKSMKAVGSQHKQLATWVASSCRELPRAAVSHVSHWEQVADDQQPTASAQESPMIIIPMWASDWHPPQLDWEQWLEGGRVRRGEKKQKDTQLIHQRETE